NHQSDWSNTVVLTPSSCAMPTGVTSSNVTATSAKISWAGNAASYEVRYGVDITTAGGQVVTVTTNEAVLTGLDEETQYDVYVRAVCDGATSNWTAKYQFTTTAGGEGINDVIGSDVVLYPNPASTQVTLAGLETGAMVTVVDLNGRRCGQWKTTAESMTIDLTGYAQGAYFVRIVGEQGTVVRKLIVK
ncbi:MAG: T9SS type A sorting domain-containing protein, partial [Bacteroidales bacterium]|nr:T9SS type A sorting domain-containing protein [Bacteroidales bacterium]